MDFGVIMINEDFLEVKVHNVGMTRVGFVVFLKPEGDSMLLPIFIGAAEAHSILAVLNEEPVPRPLTHDLMKNVLEVLDCRVTQVAITSLSNSTFYGRVYFSNGVEETDIDARPSDSLALALRYKVPIYCHKDVLESAGVPEEQVEGLSQAEKADEPLPDDIDLVKAAEEGDEALAEEAKPATPRTPMDKLQARLRDAVEQERYEEAARIRDEIRRIEKGN